MAAVPWRQLMLLCLLVLYPGVSPVFASEAEDDGQQIPLVPEANGFTGEVSAPDFAVPRTELPLPVSQMEREALEVLGSEGGTESPHHGPEDHQESPELQINDSGQDCNQTLPPEKKHQVAEAVMKLGITLLRGLELQNSQENFLFSPFSVSLALAHLALGAANHTEKELLKALHMESVSCLHPTLRSLIQDLRKSVISIATSLYLQKGFAIKEKFLQESERFYGAKPAMLSGNSEADLAAINNWVKKATNGQIPTMLSELPASVVMVLLNAVHFRGFWKNKFDPLQTELGLFHLNEQSTVSVEMMKSQTYPLSWFMLDSLDVQVAKFPFKGNMSFLVILPNSSKRNFSQLLTDLGKVDFAGPVFPEERPTLVKMPKLDLQSSTDLKQIFNRLGLLQLPRSSDFSRIADGPLFVSNIQHRAGLELNEAGVEASAATSVLVFRTASIFYVNRPFLFLILDDETRIPLFLGAVRNPNPGAPRERKTENCIPMKDSESSLACKGVLEKP